MARRQLALCIGERDVSDRTPEQGSNPAPAIAAQLWLALHLPDIAELNPGLAVARHESAQVAASADLDRLARWSMRFTPVVSRVPPDGLLLEIRGSLNLFGGLDRLLARVRLVLARRYPLARLAVAPTPEAALVLARAGHAEPVVNAEALRAALARVAVTRLRLPDDIAQALRRLGTRTIAECLRLPRADLARRLGPEFLHLLDRLTGLRADPRVRIALPDCFEAEVDLPWAERDGGRLLAGATVLLEALGDYLDRRCSASDVLHWRWLHADRTATEFGQRLLAPQRDPGLIAALLAERLQRLPLPAAVVGIALRVDRYVARQEQSMDAFAMAKGAATDTVSGVITELLERLQARLGMDAIGTLACCREHRPERAWRWRRCDAGARPERELARDERSLRRPLWLLPEPRRLSRTLFTPRPGRERIESGWWDDLRINRDYRVADTRHGERLWVFHDLQQPGQWYLHGYFG